MEHGRNGRERLHLDPSLDQLGLDLAERDALPLRRHLPQRIRMGLEQGTAIATNLGRGGAAGLTQSLHQLDRRRRADLEAVSRLPDRAAVRNCANNPLAKIARQRCRHRELQCSSPPAPSNQNNRFCATPNRSNTSGRHD